MGSLSYMRSVVMRLIPVIQTNVFWDVTPCSIRHIPDDSVWTINKKKTYNVYYWRCPPSRYALSIVFLSRNEGLAFTRRSSYVLTTTSSDNSQVLQPTLIIWPRNLDHKLCTNIGRNFHFCYIRTKVPTRCTTITSLWADSVLFCK